MTYTVDELERQANNLLETIGAYREGLITFAEMRTNARLYSDDIRACLDTLVPRLSSDHEMFNR